jgi:FkbM family methyltransferase
MAALADSSPYGSRKLVGFDRAVVALTRSLPATWLGLRMSMPLRRLVLNRLRDACVDTTVWGERARLCPERNSCEKVALFTPQLYDPVELGVLVTAIERRVGEGEIFTFVDVGANVGLYSMLVASRAGRGGRVLAIEPQPEIVARLQYNAGLNPHLNIEVFPVAVTDREGEVDLVLNPHDRGGSHLETTRPSGGNETVRVRCRPLAGILRDAKVSTIDALKLDIEGAEALALAPLLQEAPDLLLPRLVIIEDRPSDWTVDLYGLLHGRGYRETRRGRHNILFER